MRQQYLFLAILGFLFLLTTCVDNGTNPFSSKNASVDIVLKNSGSEKTDTTITDTVGNKILLGLGLYLVTHIDSVEVIVSRGPSMIDTTILYIPKQKNIPIDTPWFTLTFSEPGTRTVKATGFVEKNLRTTANAIINVLARPIPNRPPVIKISGNASITAGQICTFTVSVNDSDTLQKVMVDKIKAPANSTFSDNVFTWATTSSDIGIDTIIFIATDNDSKPLSTLDTVIITVTPAISTKNDSIAPKMQRITPIFDSSHIITSSIQVKILCSDASGIASMKCFMGNDTFPVVLVDTIATATVLGYKAGQLARIGFIAIDSSPRANRDTLYVHIFYDPTMDDRIPPAITFISPSKNTSVATDTCIVRIKCTDASGIFSVTCTRDMNPIAVTRLSDTLFSCTVTGLIAGKTSQIAVVATDSSTNANRDTLWLSVKYDNDRIAPYLRRNTPGVDSTSISASSMTVRIIGTDASGIVLMTCNLGGSSFAVTKSADSVYSANVTGLVQNQFNKVTFIAIDSSLAANSCSLNVHIKYDPTMPDSEGPVIIKKSGPTSNSVISNPIISILDSIIDPSGVDSVYWTLNGVRAGNMMLAAGSTTNFTLLDTLTAYHGNRLVIHAIDHSTQINRDSAVVQLDYNVPPVTNDTAVSTNRNVAKTWTLNSQSADNDLLIWTKISSPATTSGTVSGTLPSITFTPAVNWSGADSFYVRVTDGYWADTAKVKITVVDVPIAPTIVTQPQSQTKILGQSATFSVTINSDVNPVPSYQWKVNNVSISGAIATSYTIGAVAISDSGSYSVTISNSAGSINSQPADLTVNYAPEITVQPVSQTLYLNQSATFAITALGNPTPTYIWKKNGVTISGQNGATLTISIPGIIDSGKYTATVTNSVGAVISDTASFYAGIKKVAAGGSHSLFIKTDCTVWACGYNYYGQLGDGTTTDRSEPVQIKSLSNVINVAAGYDYSLILKSDGTLWACGNNASGQLGDGTTTSRSTPVQVLPVSNVQNIAAGVGHSLLLTNDGNFWSCGDNANGQLGNNSMINRSTPFQIMNVGNVVGIAAGGNYSLIIKGDGSFWGCGNNYSGQLGNGSTASCSTFVQVTNLSNAISITAGGNHSLILKNDKTVWACGNNSFGQLGIGTMFNCSTFVQISSIINAQSISAGETHSFILRTDGTLWAFGDNTYGQLGDGTTINRSLPTLVHGISNVQSMAAGMYHSIILKTDGTVWSFGSNLSGQLGVGTKTDRFSPVQIKF